MVEENRMLSAYEAVEYAKGDSRVILGVTDKVPPEADPERLTWLAEVVRG